MPPDLRVLGQNYPLLGGCLVDPLNVGSGLFEVRGERLDDEPELAERVAI